MKTPAAKFEKRHRSAGAAFTLVEMMIASALTTVVVAGIVYSHVTGWKMATLAQAKTGATDEIRTMLGKLVSEVRCAQRIAVGNGTSGTFTEIGDGTNQQGNAIQIYQANYSATNINSNATVRYYLTTNSGSTYLMRKEGSGTPEIFVSYITNTGVFKSLTYTNTTKTNNDDNAIIEMALELYQLRYPQTQIGTNKAFEYYRLATQITRRSN